MSIRIDIRNQVLQELNTNRPSIIPEATNRRWIPSESDAEQHLAVFFIEEPAAIVGPRGSTLVNRKLTLAVQCVANTNTPGLADDIVEPMLAWATQVLGETNLGGLAYHVIELGTQWEPAKMDKLYLLAIQRWQIEYQTRRNDLSANQ